MTISIVNGVNPLQTTLLELGIVSGRVALLLRSAEIQPVFGRFSMNGISHSPPPCTVVATGRLCCLALHIRCDTNTWMVIEHVLATLVDT